MVVALVRRKTHFAKTGKAIPFKMNAKHKAFCRGIVSGLTKRAAYIEAGFSGKNLGGPGWLLAIREVKAYLAHLRELQRRRLGVTLERLTLDLCRAQDLAAASDNAAAYVNATMGLAKLYGFLKEEREGDVNIFINRPLREPTHEIELTPDQWIAKWSPKPIGNGHDKTNGQG